MAAAADNYMVPVKNALFIGAFLVGASYVVKKGRRHAAAKASARRRKYLSPSSIRRYNLGDVAADATAAARRGECGAARRMLATAGDSLRVEYARDRVEEVCEAQTVRSAPSFMGLGRRRKRR